ncbi:aminodeoxychorismate lyase, partial [Pseudoalteromonas phenolica]
MNKKIIYSVIAIVFLIGGIIGFNLYQKIFGKSITKDGVIYVGSNYHLIDVKKLLHEYTNSP